MNFNVYVDQKTAEDLDKLAKRRRTSRNALVREALAHLVKQGGAKQWPQGVLDFQGIPSMPAFESSRKKLRAPKQDPLA